jgi:hypothetical protein
MVLFHSCQSLNHVRHLIELVRQREDEVVYATPFPQRDYGPILVKLEVRDSLDSLNDSYDQGGYASLTQNYCVPTRMVRGVEVVK